VPTNRQRNNAIHLNAAGVVSQAATRPPEPHRFLVLHRRDVADPATVHDLLH
jgi:hypothetical protein